MKQNDENKPAGDVRSSEWLACRYEVLQELLSEIKAIDSSDGSCDEDSRVNRAWYSGFDAAILSVCGVIETKANAKLTDEPTNNQQSPKGGA